MWNKLLTLALMLLALLPCRAQGGSGRLLRFDPAIVQLGEIESADGPVTVTFRFTNISDAAVSIVDVHAQCGCTEPEFSRASIAPGQESSLRVILHTRDLSGPQKRNLTVISSDGTRRRYSSISIECNVIQQQ